MKSVPSQFLAGFLAPFIGALMIANHRSLLRLSLIPFFVTMLVMIVGLAFGLPLITHYVHPFTQSLLSFLSVKATSPVGQSLSWIFPFLIWPALALALVYCLLTLTRLVASPFYGLLAERVLRNAGALRDERTSVVQKFRSNLRQTRSAILKTAIFLVMGIVLGILSFLPGIGVFTTLLFLILLGYDVIDYSLEALGWDLPKRFAFFRQHFAVFLGLGLSLGLVFLVPGLNFFVLPASVCGASDVVRRMIRE